MFSNRILHGGGVRQVCPTRERAGKRVDTSTARVPTPRWPEGWTNLSYTSPCKILFLASTMQNVPAISKKRQNRGKRFVLMF